MSTHRTSPLASVRHRRMSRGFTLVELVMVIILLGVLSIVALPRFGDTEAIRSAVFRDEVVAALRYARTTAVSHRRLVCASVSANGVTLTIAATNPASTCTHSLPGPDGNAAFASSAVGLINSGSGTILFQPAGTAGPEGGGTATLTIGIQGEPAITVVGRTGYVG